MTPNPHLRRFAYFVAGPRDFVINLVINGVIAWWIFGGGDLVPLSGANSIFKMLLPMSAIESTLTSFFGLLNGIQELKRIAANGSSHAGRGRWFATAVIYSLINGAIGLLVVVGLSIAANRFAPDGAIAARYVPAVVGVLSGLLAYVLHSQAVIRSETLVPDLTPNQTKRDLD